MLYKITVTLIDAGTRADDAGERPFFLFFLLLVLLCKQVPAADGLVPDACTPVCGRVRPLEISELGVP